MMIAKRMRRVERAVFWFVAVVGAPVGGRTVDATTTNNNNNNSNGDALQVGICAHLYHVHVAYRCKLLLPLL